MNTRTQRVKLDIIAMFVVAVV